MSFPGGGTRETPEVYDKISRRNFWPGSKSKWRAGCPLFSTIRDMLSNQIPIREQRHRRQPIGPLLRGRWAWPRDMAGDSLSPRPERHR
jgi:hypothetical protein